MPLEQFSLNRIASLRSPRVTG